MQFYRVNTKTGARAPTAAALVWSALTIFEKIDLCKETSVRTVICHNVAINQLLEADRLLSGK